MREFKAKKAAALAQRQAGTSTRAPQSVTSFTSRQSSNASDILTNQTVFESSAKHVPVQPSQVPAKSVLRDSDKSTAMAPNGHHSSGAPQAVPKVDSREEEQLRAQIELLTSSQSSIHNEVAEVKRHLLSRTAEVNAVKIERDAALSQNGLSEQQAREAQEKAQDSAAALQAAESTAAALQSECGKLKQELDSLNSELQEAKHAADEGADLQQQSMQDQQLINQLREQLQARTDELSSSMAEQSKRVSEGAEKASNLAAELQAVQGEQQRLQEELAHAQAEHQANVEAMQQAFDAEKSSLQEEIQGLQQGAEQHQLVQVRAKVVSRSAAPYTFVR